jgi:hypothetical protein
MWNCFKIRSTLLCAGTGSSEDLCQYSVAIPYQNTRSYFPGDSNLHNSRRGNSKSPMRRYGKKAINILHVCEVPVSKFHIIFLYSIFRESWVSLVRLHKQCLELAILLHRTAVEYNVLEIKRTEHASWDSGLCYTRLTWLRLRQLNSLRNKIVWVSLTWKFGPSDGILWSL